MKHTATRGNLTPLGYLRRSALHPLQGKSKPDGGVLVRAEASLPLVDLSSQFSMTSCTNPFITCSPEGMFTGRLFSVCQQETGSRHGRDLYVFFFFFGRLVETTCLRTDAGMKGTILTICARLMWCIFHSVVGEEASRPTQSRTLVGFSWRKKCWCQPEPRESPVTPGSPPPPEAVGVSNWLLITRRVSTG